MNAYQGQKPDTVFDVTELINVSYYTLPEGFVFEGEQHDFWELVYVEKGRFGIHIDGVPYVLEAGDMDIYPPNVFHDSRNLGQEPVSVLVLAFDGRLLRPQFFEKHVLHLGEVEQRCMDTILREAAGTYCNFNNAPGMVSLIRREDSPIGSEQILKNRLEELFIYLNRRNSGQMEKRKNTSQAVESVQEFISRNYGKKLTLQLLAEAQSISVTHLKRIFKAQTGKTVLTFLTEVRIREAKRRIRKGKLNFSQIAQEVGFDSIYYFSEVFKKETGMTPTEYAKESRNS